MQLKFRIWFGISCSGNRKSAIGNPKWLRLSGIAFVLVVTGAVAQAQQSGKVHRVGVLFIGGRNQPHLDAFKRGLHERGYVEGKNISFEYRYAEGQYDRLPALAAELVRLQVEVIVTTASVSAHAARQVTTTTPIVMTSGDPVGSRLAASLAKPGGNVTGLTVLLSDLSGKRLELLKETLPKISRVVTLWNSKEPIFVTAYQETQSAAKAYSLQLFPLDIHSLNDIEKGFASVPKAGVNALLVILNPLVTLHSKRVVELANHYRLPGMYPTRQFAEEGGLMAYGPLISDLYRRAATYVDKILRGAKPSELPIEQPTKFELLINLKTASRLRVRIPADVLIRADEVIQ